MISLIITATILFLVAISFIAINSRKRIEELEIKLEHSLYTLELKNTRINELLKTNERYKDTIKELVEFNEDTILRIPYQKDMFALYLNTLNITEKAKKEYIRGVATYMSGKTGGIYGVAFHYYLSMFGLYEIKSHKTFKRSKK